ncbi:MAG: hypothetical protein OXF79_01990 [Chloroflexi bacterium]|nr:hypothetical protein [Chloroflexota bacterium]
MSSLAKKHDDSRLSARLAVLMGLVMSGFADGLLSPESLRTSPLALSYAVGLGAMGVSTLTFMLRGVRQYLNPEETAPEPEPRTGPVWHEARFFTDPWYQVPAIYCVLVLVVQLIVDLEAGPPLSDRTLWFLVFVAFATVTIPASISRRVRLESAGNKDSSADGNEARRTFAPGFRDPWFTVPAAALGAVHLAKFGVEAIEEDPTSSEATWWLLSPLLSVALAVAMPSIDRFRRRRKLRNAAESESPKVPVDAVPSESESP